MSQSTARVGSIGDFDVTAFCVILATGTCRKERKAKARAISAKATGGRSPYRGCAAKLTDHETEIQEMHSSDGQKRRSKLEFDSASEFSVYSAFLNRLDEALCIL
jgi:hypothetical protein